MLIRDHDVGRDRTWKTISDGPGFREGHVMVPVHDLAGMSATQIGEAVLGLVDQTRVTELYSWVCSTCRWLLNTNGLSSIEDIANKLCPTLGDNRGGQVAALRENFPKLEALRGLDPSLEDDYRSIRGTLDGVYEYLRTKRSKLTARQSATMDLILDLRHGCRLCRLLDGKHTQTCQPGKRRLSKSGASHWPA
jgi:hypothetical protein